VLAGGKAYVEPPAGAALRDVLAGGEQVNPWVPLYRWCDRSRLL